MAWQCFLVKETGTDRASLRRYAGGSGSCPGRPYGYHTAEVVVGYVPHLPDALCGDTHPHDDPRWPTTCAYCPYRFTEGDGWQHNLSEAYTRPEGGDPFTLHQAPIGAMWPATWRAGLSRAYLRDRAALRPPIVLQTPGGAWVVDGASANGEGWEVSGEPPRITARPSIHCIGLYHGWLTDGVLSDDIDGRVFPPATGGH